LLIFPWNLYCLISCNTNAVYRGITHTLLLEAFTYLADELSYIWIYQNNSWVMYCLHNLFFKTLGELSTDVFQVCLNWSIKFILITLPNYISYKKCVIFKGYGESRYFYTCTKYILSDFEQHMKIDNLDIKH
jgi:hypothetical protein